MKFKVFSIAVDSHQYGIDGGAYATRTEAFKHLIDSLGLENDAEAKRLLDFGDLTALEDYLTETQGKLTNGATWSHDEWLLEFPVVNELVTALEQIAAIAAAGVVHRHETGKPQWCAFDEQTKIALAAIAKAKEGIQ